MAQPATPPTWHLYLPKLVTVLREGYGARQFRADLVAGLTVAIVALPLAMALAIASGTSPEKGLHTAIEALQHVPGTLLIIGRGPLEWQLKEFAKHLRVADRVRWWGHATRDELIGAYRAATALWFPSVARSDRI